jgi:hypothetical protein
VGSGPLQAIPRIREHFRWPAPFRGHKSRTDAIELKSYLCVASPLVALCLWFLVLHVLEGAEFLHLSRAASFILGCGVVALGMWLTERIHGRSGRYYLCSSHTLDRATLAALGQPPGAPGVVLLSRAQISHARRGGARVHVVGGPYLEEHWEFSHEYELTMRSVGQPPQRTKDSK